MAAAATTIVQRPCSAQIFLRDRETAEEVVINHRQAADGHSRSSLPTPVPQSIDDAAHVVGRAIILEFYDTGGPEQPILATPRHTLAVLA
jgi:hypothetical protein